MNETPLTREQSNTETSQLYRLLKEGERKERGDLVPSSDFQLMPTLEYGAYGNGMPTQRNEVVLRPITADLWHDYATDPPKKEDGSVGCHPEYVGRIEVVYKDGSFGIERWNETRACQPTHWRRITPPQPPKPKSTRIDLYGSRGLNSGVLITGATLKADGSVELQCGDVIASESVEEFISKRESLISASNSSPKH